MMKRLALLCALATATTQAHALIQIDLIAAPAPNVFGSSSFLPWFNNAQQALRTGANSMGSGFSYYENVSGTTRSVTEAAVTGFNSWGGVAGQPGEFGQRMHFVYRIYDSNNADVVLENIRNIQFSATWRDGSGDAFGPFDFDNTTTFDPLKRVGYLSNGTQITSGNQAVKQIIGTFGLAYEPDPNWTGSDQDKLDQLIAVMGDPTTGLARMDANIGYMLPNEDVFNRSQFVNYLPVPEPASLAVLSIGAIALLRRRKK